MHVDRVRTLLAVLFATTLVGLIAIQALRSVVHVRVLDNETAELARTPANERPDALSVIGDDAAAFRQFHPLIRAGDRFIVVVEGRDDPARYQLVSQSYFYPGQAVASLGDADMVLMVGGPQLPRPTGFIEIASSGEAWLGRRAS